MSITQQKYRIWETDYGQDCGWIIERRGEEIGILTDPRYEEMFWTSYRMEITTDDGELAERMKTKKFWDSAEAEGIEWRNREFGVVAELAHPSGTPFPEPGRLSMRALKMPLREPNAIEWIVLWVRRVWKKS
ncbi:MAG: hypothetical protein AAF591_00530 [Verrucomicrobiota bacterium]